jgi:hypothetical protein
MEICGKVAETGIRFGPETMRRWTFGNEEKKNGK